MINIIASIVACAFAVPPLWLLLVYLVSMGFGGMVSVTLRLGASDAVASLVALLAAAGVLFVALAAVLSLGDGSSWTVWAVGLLSTGFCYGVGAAIASRRSPETEVARPGLWLVDDEALRSRSEEVSA